MTAPFTRMLSSSAIRSQDILVKQGADVIKKAKLAEELLLDEHNVWNDLDAFMLDEIVAATGVCRDFVNSLKPEEESIVEKANGAVSKTEAVEDMLRAALKCDELGARVHKLRVAVEDEGTRGDGDNIPGAFKKEWDVETDKLFNEYSTLLETVPSSLVPRIERDLGYQFLLFKRTIHIDSFRYHFPKVHPSGFSASAD